ncbi:arrestin domain-containing protein 3-like [Aplochiton taeniatus]
MNVVTKARTKFTFVSKSDMTLPELLQPQYGSKEKDVGFFASGSIALNVYTEKMVYPQGEALKIIVEVNNSSSRTVKPKFYLYEKQTVYAQGQRRVNTKNILKEKSDPVKPSTRQTVHKVITIPVGLPASILNCPILKLEYGLKVILDVALTKNPEVKLPIIVLPNLDFTPSKELQAYS